MEIVQKIIPVGQKNQRPGYAMTPKYITVHNTANDSKGADAYMHARYLLNGGGGRTVGWHFTVDDKAIYQHLPTNESGWHAGDGNGAGNRQSIGIEICENSDGDFENAVANAQWLIEKLMKDHGISKANVVTHKKWSGKNCPHKLIGRWLEFIDGIGTKVIDNKVSGESSKKPNSKSIDQLADEVIAGKHGSGAQRKKSLGSQYDAVQKRVNEKLLGTKATPKPAAKSIDQLVKETIAGKHGNGAARKKSLGKNYQAVQDAINGKASTPKKASKPKTFKVGQKVKIKSSAKKYATGQAIPAQYKNKSYTIQQVKSDRILIKELVSWVKKSDVQ